MTSLATARAGAVSALRCRDVKDYGPLLAAARQEWEAAAEACLGATGAPLGEIVPNRGFEVALGRLERAISALTSLAEDYFLASADRVGRRGRLALTVAQVTLARLLVTGGIEPVQLPKALRS